jgi:xylulokinase
VTPLLLGIDVGTSFVKAVLATPDGRVVAQAQAGYATNHPRPGWAEQDPHDWWRGVVSVTRQVLAVVGSGPWGTAHRAVAGIGVSGQGCAVTLIGGSGEALYPAIIWMDNRSEPQCERLRQECASQILHINGKSPAPYNADPVLMWLQEHAPGLIDAARCSLTTTGYVNFKLTGHTVTNASDASILFAYDLAHGRWSSSLLEAFGLPARLYPEVQPCRHVIGGLTPAAAADLGLAAGIPVIAGGEDTSSAGLALGAVRPGMAFLSLGTAGTLYATEARPLVHPQLLTFAHVLEHQYLVGGSMGAIGAALAWLRSALGEQEDHAALVDLAATANPGADNLIFLPYLNGELQPINDGYARGVFFGLGMHTGKAELVRAVLEGAAYAIAQNLEYAELLSGPILEVRATGGPTRSTLWCQIIADVCNRPLSVLVGEGGAPLGNALLAGSGVGLIGDIAAAAENAAGARKHYAPDAGRHELYGRLFSVYKQLYPNLKDLYVELARC